LSRGSAAAHSGSIFASFTICAQRSISRAEKAGADLESLVDEVALEVL
jgi:hypothetical protein